MVAFSDANYAGDHETAKSTTGFCFLLQGAALSWIGKLQSCVATSSQMSEYMAAGSAAREGVWLRMVLAEFGHAEKEPTLFSCDSESALNLIKNPVISPKTKHVNVSYHYTREQVTNGTIKFKFVGTNSMVADILTKNLARQKLEGFRRDLGVRY